MTASSILAQERAVWRAGRGAGLGEPGGALRRVPPPELLLLPAPADVVQRALVERDDVEGTQHRTAVRRLADRADA